MPLSRLVIVGVFVGESQKDKPLCECMYCLDSCSIDKVTTTNEDDFSLLWRRHPSYELAPSPITNLPLKYHRGYVKVKALSSLWPELEEELSEIRNLTPIVRSGLTPIMSADLWKSRICDTGGVMHKHPARL
ncbi:unnamed protein product [Lota lota]